MYWANPRFRNWHDLIDDILFNRLTIKEAAEKWKISQPAISQWLKKHPSIKKYYYTRPWVQRQRQLRFLPQECLDCQDMIDILEDESGERYVLEVHFLMVNEHIASCERCRRYQVEKRLEIGIPYRLDCPSIQDLLDYLNRDEIDTDTIISRHLLRCAFCADEANVMGYSLDENIYRFLNLVEQERNLYPAEGWRARLTSADILQELIDVMEERCAGPTSQLMYNYCSWRRLRRSLLE